MENLGLADIGDVDKCWDNFDSIMCVEEVNEVGKKRILADIFNADDLDLISVSRPTKRRKGVLSSDDTPNVAPAGLSPDSVSIAGYDFPSLSDLKSFLNKDTISSLKPGSKVSGKPEKILFELIKYHPSFAEKTKGQLIKSFNVSILEVLRDTRMVRQKCFWLVRGDGSTTDFSVNKALDMYKASKGDAALVLKTAAGLSCRVSDGSSPSAPSSSAFLSSPETRDQIEGKLRDMHTRDVLVALMDPVCRHFLSFKTKMWRRNSGEPPRKHECPYSGEQLSFKNAFVVNRLPVTIASLISAWMKGNGVGRLGDIQLQAKDAWAGRVFTSWELGSSWSSFVLQNCKPVLTSRAGYRAALLASKLEETSLRAHRHRHQHHL